MAPILVNPVTTRGTGTVPGTAPETVAQVVTGASWAMQIIVKPKSMLLISIEVRTYFFSMSEYDVSNQTIQ
jgi:hypothetical protein